MRPRTLFLGILLFLAAAVLVGILLWRPAPPGPDPADPSTPATPAAQHAPRRLGPEYHANTILDNPFPDDPALAPTHISLDGDHADLDSILEKLAAAANCSITPALSVPHNRTPPTLDLQLKDQPWLEALLQFRAQAGVTVFLLPGKPVTFRLEPKPTLPGTWCISGPFAFVITSIEHTYTLGRDGQPIPPNSSYRPESFTAALSTFAEPKLHLLQFPSDIRLLQAVDENGHSLILDPQYVGGRSSPLPPSVFHNIGFMLSYPKDHPGRTIKLLKANADFVVQLGSKSVEFSYSPDTTPAPKDAGGITVAPGRINWHPVTHFGFLNITYRQGTLDEATWSSLRPALEMAFLTIEPTGNSQNANIHGIASGSDPSAVTVNYPINPGNTPRNPADFVPPTITSFSIRVPTAARQVTVPFEFHDLPLP